MDKTAVTGLSEFREQIAQGIRRQRDELRKQLDRLGMQMTVEIKAAAPVLSGATRASVRYVVLDTEKGEKLQIKVGDATAFYVQLVELGSAHAPAHPFVRPVVYRHERLAPGQLAEGVEKAWQ